MRKKQIHKNLLDKKEWDLKFNKAVFKIEKTIGYLDKNTSRWLDLLHYSSIPSLVSYKVFGKWILFPWFYNIAPINKWFERLIRSNVSVGNSAALFYVLVKTTAS